MVEITKGLILASASPRRLELLKKINIIPESIEPAEIDETPKKKKNQLNIAKDLQKKKESLFLKNFLKRLFFQLIQLLFVAIEFLGKPKQKMRQESF